MVDSRWLMELSSLATLHSSLLVEPFFPAALEHEDVFQLCFVAKPSRDLTAGAATLAAAIHDHSFFRRPFFQQQREQFIPAVFVQQDRAADVIALELFVRPCINPDRVLTPGARLRERDHFGSRNWRVPRNLFSKINRLPDSGQKRQGDENQRLAQQRRFHGLLHSWRVHHPRVHVKCFG